MPNEEQTIEELIDIINRQSIELSQLNKKLKLLELENSTLKGEISENINRDELTGLYNRSIANEAYLRSKTVVMCDIDDFKHINDTYGHNFGDFILVKIADILKSNVRSTDYAVRWGGEEFVIFIDNASVEVASALAERIRMKTEKLEGEILEDGFIVPLITMSFGVSKLHSSDDLTSDIEMVDNALYDSKRSGKNKITVYQEDKGYSLKKKI